MLDNIANILISPLNQCILGVLLGLALLKFTAIARWIGKSIVVITLVWGFLCSQYFFSYWLIAPLEDAFPPIKINSEQWQQTNAIWVLACYHFDAEQLPRVTRFNHCSLERLVHAANMYRVKKMPIYLTGTDFVSDSALQHAEQAAMFLKALGVDQSDIIIINKGSNTATEMAQISMALGQLEHPTTLAVVSSATHGLRLSKMLAANNLNYVFIPVHYATDGKIKYTLNTPSTHSWARSERAFYEYAALVKYWFSS